MINLRKLKDMDRDDVLNLVGLETKRTTVDWVLPTLGIFSVGLLVGAGIGLLLAPKSGEELREDLRHRLQKNNLDTHAFAPGTTPAERVPRTL